VRREQDARSAFAEVRARSEAATLPTVGEGETFEAKAGQALGLDALLLARQSLGLRHRPFLVRARERLLGERRSELLREVEIGDELAMLMKGAARIVVSAGGRAMPRI
jgi:hypothetical protein